MKTHVLFLCTHNCARSQMAEGLLRKLTDDRFSVFSAEAEQTRVQPLAIEAMRDVGIDTTGHTPKALDAFVGERFDFVFTVCDRASQSCPTSPRGTERLHGSFEKPTAATGSDNERRA